MKTTAVFTQSAEHTKRKGARHLALELFLRREEVQSPLDQLLRTMQESACRSPEEKALLHELVYGVYRWRGRLDWIIDFLVRKRPEKLPPAIRYILQLGLYQLLFLQRIPPFAIVHESVELAKQFGHPGTAKLVNGVLREACRRRFHFPYPSWETAPTDYLTVVHSHPRWLVERWITRWGPSTAKAICMANNQYPPLHLRTNSLRTTRLALLTHLQHAGIAAIPSPIFSEGIRLRESVGRVADLPGYAEGWFQIQDAGAMLISSLCAPQPGMHLLDACAAPGGKTTHLAEQMQDRGLIVALDRSRRRLHRLRENCRRLGIHSVWAVQGEGEHIAFHLPFDQVLLDAPCSGLGVLRRHPEGKWEKDSALILHMSARQTRLLDQVQSFVRKGGVLVYSVCSCEPEETEVVVQRFLQHHPYFVLESLSSFVPAALSPLLQLGGKAVLSLPGLCDLDGFFAVRLRRK